MSWDVAFEAECHRLVETVCGTSPPAERDRAWRRLLARIGEPIEAWAARSPLLRRARLSGEDEARAVLLGVIERLAADDFDNLRAYLSRRGPRAGDDLDRLVRLGDDDSREDEAAATPLRAWLLTLVKFVERDHVRSRLGWGAGDKRDVGSHAERLPTSPQHGERPPITDALTVARVMQEVRAHIAAFPDEMRRALELWSEDVPFDEIAAQLGVGDAGKAKNLVRAAQARLRERFRDRVPELFGGAA